MARKLGLVAAWALATLVSVLIAAQAVGGVRDRVTDRPSELPESVALSIAATTPQGSETGPGAPSPAAPDATVTTARVAVDPIPAPQPPPTTSTDTTEPPSTEGPEPSTDDDPPTSTTTTTTGTVSPTTEAPLEYAHYDLTGGFVDIGYRPEEVFLVGATPNPGYRVSVSSPGPEKVEVTFKPLDESEPYEGEFDAEWKGGQLDVDIDERFDEED